jgi:hypothetical protein
MELLSAVLGKPNLKFAKPIFDLVDNPHLRPLVRCIALRVGGQGSARKGLALCPEHSASRDERTGTSLRFFGYLHIQRIYSVCTKVCLFYLVHARYVLFMSYQFTS